MLDPFIVNLDDRSVLFAYGNDCSSCTAKNTTEEDMLTIGESRWTMMDPESR